MKKLLMSIVLGFGLVSMSFSQRQVSGQFENGRYMFELMRGDVLVKLFSGGYNVAGYEILSAQVDNTNNFDIQVKFRVRLDPYCDVNPSYYTFTETIKANTAKGGSTGMGAHVMDINYDAKGCKEPKSITSSFKSLVMYAVMEDWEYSRIY